MFVVIGARDERENIVGVASSLERAKYIAQKALEERDESYYEFEIVQTSLNEYYLIKPGSDHLVLIASRKDGKGGEINWKEHKKPFEYTVSDPTVEFAVAVLNCDPIAIDAVKDILKL